jgi:hypothetical protein
MRRVVLILAAVSSTCWAGGTLDESELMPLLDQKPQVKQFILQNFDMPNGAWAEVRLSSDYKHLGGQRLGPYTIRVRAKGAETMSTIVLTLCTTYRFLDRAGKPMKRDSPREQDAFDVQEKLVSVQLRPLEEADRRPVCP